MLRSQASARSSGGRSLLSRVSRTSSSVTERSSNRKQRSGSGNKTKWRFGRKSNKSISQQGTTSGDDDFLPVFSPTGEGEGGLSLAPPTSGGGVSQESSSALAAPSTTEGQRLASQSSITSVESQSPLIPPSDSDSRDRVNRTAPVSTNVAAAVLTSDNEQELTRSASSTSGDTLQQSSDVSTRTEEASSEEQPLIGVVITSPRESMSEAVTVETEQQQSAQEGGGGVESEGVEAVSNASPAISEVGRQSSIMRASGLSSNDRDAAVRARQRARSRSQVGDGRHRRDTDERTNEGM